MIRDFAPLPPSHEEIAHICLHTLGCLPISITILRSGAWSSALGVETERGPMVIRFSATAADFRADEHASRFVQPHLPIPHVYGIGRLGELWWCISERMPGVHLDVLSASELLPVVPSLVAMLKAMRDTSSGTTSGYGGWDADGNGIFPSFSDQLLDVAIDNPDQRGGGWSERFRPHTHAQTIFDAGMRKLKTLSQYIPDSRQLIHQDTINFNVTVANDHISGIFDWGCAMWGDALYDLAWFRFWDPWYPQWAELNLPDTLESLVEVQGEYASERMQCYLLHIGLGHIRYNAFTGNWNAMNEVVEATAKLIQVPAP